MAEPSQAVRQRPEDFDAAHTSNPQKRTKLDEDTNIDADAIEVDEAKDDGILEVKEDEKMAVDTEIVVVGEPDQEISQDQDQTHKTDTETKPQSYLPPSHVLLNTAPPSSSNPDFPRATELDVGISEYVSHDVPPIHGVIKQRFTDFLVFEVNQDSEVIHLKDIDMPASDRKKKGSAEAKADAEVKDAGEGEQSAVPPLPPPVDPTSTTTANETATEPEPSTSTSAVVPPPEPSTSDPSTSTQNDPSTSEPSTSNANPPPPSTDDSTWLDSYTSTLTPYLTPTAISQLKSLFEEGSEIPKPPLPERVSDGGWAGRVAKLEAKGDGADADGEDGKAKEETDGHEPEKEKEEEEVDSGRGGRGKRGRGRGRDRGRGERGGRGARGGRGGRGGGRPVDTRRVITDPISSKDKRTAVHKAIRELFGGRFETETDQATADDEAGSKIIIKWARRGGRGGRGGARGGRGGRGGGPGQGGEGRDGAAAGERTTYPPYIHFTLQKTNRDTQDALSHLSRLLRLPLRDFGTAGTKDKRGVTVQRVSLKRNGRTVEDIWRGVNQCGRGGRRGREEVVKERGERGVRVGDFGYRKVGLELGMLGGNEFVITLRNVKADSVETIDRAMNSMKTKGFINYYGMQRFGTASIPTHAIGLALLQSNWSLAVDLILSHRPGEHPDVVAARKAWLEDGDVERALELMPRRVVAERCLLESFRTMKGDTRNKMGALSTIPRNLRLMYIHAYQSYVWNAIVSERIRLHGAEKPIPGDLVYDTKPDEKAKEAGDEDAVDADGEANEPENEQEKELSGRQKKRNRKPWEPPSVKTLTEEDVDQYTMFDVLMPLPGKDVAYPGGSLGEKYRDFLRLDGLDPDNLVRKQKEYSLSGSYRKILHLPKDLSWSVLHYTDPDVPLAQSDEDSILGFDPPVLSTTPEDGRFMALQIRLRLGTAAYATMALREITKTETGAYYQSVLTKGSADQEFRGTGAGTGSTGGVVGGLDTIVVDGEGEVVEDGDVAEAGGDVAEAGEDVMVADE